MPALLVRSVLSMCGTMLLVSIALFALLEAGSGDVTKKILGAFATPEQRESYRRQLGLDQSLWQRYASWLAGNDWWLDERVGHELITLPNPQTGESEWWASTAVGPRRWRLQGDGKYYRAHYYIKKIEQKPKQ